MKVWDISVRLFHWSLVAAVAIAWLTGEATLRLHEAAGYVGVALIALRSVWGWTGGRFARFDQFLRRPSVVRSYAADVIHRRAKRYLGHNPLGGWMAVALMLIVVSTCVTGWLYTLDIFWGMAWLERLHRGLAWALVGLIGVHVAGVIFTGWRHRENLVTAMITGRKRPANSEDLA